MMNMYSDSKKQWSPFVGCDFACTYCVPSFQRQTKRVGGRFKCDDCSNYKPHYHESRLENRLPKTSGDEFIFVCASGDVSFCDTVFLKRILEKIAAEKDKTFLLQSKNPATFNRVASYPVNLMLGTTIETDNAQTISKFSKAPAPADRAKALAKVPHSRKTITIEPVIKFSHAKFLKLIKSVNPERIWLGLDSKKCGLPEPTPAEFWKLHRDLAGYKVGLKTVPAN